MITREQAIKVLWKLLACYEARAWFRNSELEPEQAWNQCNRANWLIWLADKLGIDKHTIILVAHESAKSVLHLIPEDEKRPQQTLEVMEKWLAGEAISKEQLEDAFKSAYDAAHGLSHADYAAYAVSSALYTAIAPNFFTAAHAETTVSYAADAARKKSQDIDVSGIVRKRISWQMIEESINKLVEKEGVEF